MIVCHCKGISDRTIRRAIRSGAQTVRQVARSCAAGTGCGGCHAAIGEILESECPGAQATELFSLADYAPAR